MTFAISDTETGQKFYDETYFKIEVHQVSHSFNASTRVAQTDLDERAFSIWNDNFPEVNERFQKIADALKVQNFWPDNHNFTLRGSAFSDVHKYIQIKVTKWVNGTSVVCKTPAEIETQTKKTNFLVGVLSKYIDFDDYTEPIKAFLETKFASRLVPGLHKKNTLYLRKSEATLIDRYIQIGHSEEKEFYSIVNPIS